MKVIIELSSTTSISSMRGWVNALTLLGHSALFYDSKLTPIFDIFDEHSPDIFISTVNDVSRGMAKVLCENPETITVFYSPPFGRISGENIEYVKDLKKETGKPDVIFSFAELNTIKEWQSHGFKIVSLPKAADNIFYTPLPYQETWSSDIAFVGNYQASLDEYIVPLCNQTKWSFRIFGGGDWPCANYVGNVQPENLKNIFSSSKLILDIVPEGHEATDIPFNVLACGGNCISNSYDTFPANIGLFKTSEEMSVKIEEFFKSVFPTLHGQPSAQIIPSFTYLDRIKELLTFIGLEDEIHG